MTGEEVRLPAWRRFAGGAIVAASLAALAAAQRLLLTPEEAAGLRLLPVAMAVAAVGALLLHRRGEPAPSGAPPFESWEKLFLAGAVLAAAALRFPYLGLFPPGGFFDESQNVLVADSILKGSWPIFVGGASQMPALYFYPVAAAIGTFGTSIASIRGVSALCGTAAVPLLYLLTRRYYAREVAAAATVLLVGSRWHLNFSRIGFNGILSPLMELLTFLALVRALERRRRVDWVLLGAGIGIGLQTYYAFNLFPAVLAVALVSLMLASGSWKNRGEVRSVIRGLALAAGTALLLLAPLALFAVRHPETFFQRAGTVAIWNPAHGLKMPEALYSNIQSHLLMFVYRGDGNPRHNIPDAPLLTTIEGVLLAFGLACALARGLRWPRPAWLAWFAVMLLPGILTIEAPQAYRTVGVIPVLFLLIAEGLQTMVGAASGRRRPSPLLGAGLGALAAATAAWSAVVYFEVQVQDPRVWHSFQAKEHDIARFLKENAAGREHYIDPGFFGVPTFRVYLGPAFRSSRFRLSDHFPVQARAFAATNERPALYTLDGPLVELVPLFRAAFPHAASRRHLAPDGTVAFVSIEVPAGDRQHLEDVAACGYLGSFYPNAEWRGAPTLVRRDPAVFFHFHWDQDALVDPFTADWVARLKVDEPGEYGFEMLASGPALVVLDGQTVVRQALFESENPVRGSVTLSPGEHVLAIRYLERSFASTIRVWWQPPSSRRSVIPLRRLTALTPGEYEALRDSLPRP